MGARGVEDRRELAGMAKHDETIEVVAQRELSRRLGWGGRRWSPANASRPALGPGGRGGSNVRL